LNGLRLSDFGSEQGQMALQAFEKAPFLATFGRFSHGFSAAFAHRVRILAVAALKSADWEPRPTDKAFRIGVAMRKALSVMATIEFRLSGRHAEFQ